MAIKMFGDSNNPPTIHPENSSFELGYVFDLQSKDQRQPEKYLQ